MEKIYLHIDNTSVRDGNEKVSDLKNMIKRTTGEELKIIKGQSNRQDAGTIIEIILASKAILEIAKGIGIWLQRNSGTTISYKDETGKEIVIKNLDSKDAHLADLFKIK